MMSAAATTMASATLPSAFAVTTTFTAPTQCAQSVGGLTMLENDAFRIWLNAPLPVPGTTISSCYPDQFMSSFLLQTGGITQAPFDSLVCPSGWTTQGPFTSNYIACCPGGYGFAPYSDAPSDRPAFSGTCFTNIYNVPIQITSYDKSAIKASSIFTATGTSDQAFAYPYEGFALGVAVLASTTGSSHAAAASGQASIPFEETDANSGGMTHGAVAGLVIGCILTVILLVALAVFALNYRHKRLMDRRMQFSFYDSHIRLADSPTPMMFMDRNDRGSLDTELYSNRGNYDVKKVPVELETPRPKTIYEMEAAALPIFKTKRLPDIPMDQKL